MIQNHPWLQHVCTRLGQHGGSDFAEFPKYSDPGAPAEVEVLLVAP